MVCAAMKRLRTFEDFRVGQTIELGAEQELTREEIVEFARRWDPQPFHLDEDAGRASPFGGLIASGWHSVCLFMGMYVREILNGTESMGSPGVDAIRWLVPVRPGDRLRARATVTALEPSARRADRGTVHSHCELVNQRDEVVMTLEARGYVGRRSSPRWATTSPRG